MDLAEIIIAVIYYALYSFSIITNSILLYMILFETPRNLRVYSITLLSSTILDLISSVSFLLTIPSLHLVGNVGVHKFNGVCTLFDTSVCEVFFNSGIASLASSFPALAVSFAYRYRRLTSNKMHLSHVVICCIFVHVGSILMILCSMAVRLDDNILREYLISQEVSYAYSVGKSITGMSILPSAPMIYVYVWACLGSSLSFSAIFYFRYQINKILLRTRQSMSVHTVNMHTMLTKALIIQACLPSVNIIILFVDLLTIVGWTIPHADEMQFAIIAFLPALTPCVSMYFIAPYRRKLLCICRKSYHSTTTTVQRSAMISIAVTPRITHHSSGHL